MNIEEFTKALGAYKSALDIFQWLKQSGKLPEDENPSQMAFDYAFKFTGFEEIAKELILKERRSQLKARLEGMTLEKLKDRAKGNQAFCVEAALNSRLKSEVIEAILDICDRLGNYEAL